MSEYYPQTVEREALPADTWKWIVWGAVKR